MGDTEAEREKEAVIEAVIDASMAAAKECLAGKVWYRSKVVWAAIVTAAIWVTTAAVGWTDDPRVVMVLGIGTSVLWVILRKLTTQPMLLKAHKDPEPGNPASHKRVPWPPPVLPVEFGSGVSIDGPMEGTIAIPEGTTLTTTDTKKVVPMPPPEKDEIAIIQKGLDAPKEGS